MRRLGRGKGVVSMIGALIYPWYYRLLDPWGVWIAEILLGEYPTVLVV